jgi:hypothetical protein
MHPKSRIRDQARLQAARRSNEEDICGVARYQLARDRERRDDVAPGSSGGDEHAKSA